AAIAAPRRRLRRGDLLARAAPPAARRRGRALGGDGARQPARRGRERHRALVARLLGRLPAQPALQPQSADAPRRAAVGAQGLHAARDGRSGRAGRAAAPRLARLPRLPGLARTRAGGVRPAEADVLVVGGGPAGSTAAALLAERGRRVVLLEKASFPREKP